MQFECSKYKTVKVLPRKTKGTTENTVRIQIYTTIITYCMVAIGGHDLKLKCSTYDN